MLANVKKSLQIKKYSKPEIANLGKIGTKTQYNKNKAGSDGASNTHYNSGHDTGFVGAGTTNP